MPHLLGVIVWDGDKGGSSNKLINNFNNYTQTRLLRFNAYEADISNKPGQMGVCLTLNLGGVYGLICWQIAFVKETGIYMRDGNSNGTWGEWIKL